METQTSYVTARGGQSQAAALSPARKYSWLSRLGRDAVADAVAHGQSPALAIEQAFSSALLEYIGNAPCLLPADTPHMKRGIARQLDKARGRRWWV